MRGLVVEEKWENVKNYHSETVKDFLEFFTAAGCKTLSDLNRNFIFKQQETEIRGSEKFIRLFMKEYFEKKPIFNTD